MRKAEFLTSVHRWRYLNKRGYDSCVCQVPYNHSSCHQLCLAGFREWAAAELRSERGAEGEGLGVKPQGVREPFAESRGKSGGLEPSMRQGVVREGGNR